MASERCGALFGDKGAIVCVLPDGHEGPHASERPGQHAPSAEVQGLCDHLDEHGAPLLIYLHQGSRCTRCGTYVV